MSDKPTEADRLFAAIMNLKRESSADKHNLMRLAREATSKKGIGDMAKRLKDANGTIAWQHMLLRNRVDDCASLRHEIDQLKHEVNRWIVLAAVITGILGISVIAVILMYIALGVK